MLDTIFTHADGTIKLSEALICIGVAIVLGLVISIVYMYTDRKRKYSTNFAITLVILPAVVSIVIMLVGSDVARAFSMAGAFALVRFRSVPGDSKDIATVFFSMSIGLAAGLGYISLAGIITFIIGLLYFLLMVSNFGVKKNQDMTLRVTIPENLNYQEIFDDLFEKYTVNSNLERVKTTNLGSMYELTYNINFKKDVDEKKFIDELRCRNGNMNILLCRTELPAQML